MCTSEQPKQTGRGLQDRRNLFPSYVHLMTCCESALVFKTHIYFKCMMPFSSVANFDLHFQVIQTFNLQFLKPSYIPGSFSAHHNVA